MAGAGATIGSSSVGGLATTITINAGDIELNPGDIPAAGARIGSPAVAAAGGNINLTASGAITLNGAVAGETAIRTLGNVNLDADSLSIGNWVRGATVLGVATHAIALSGVGQIQADANAGDSITLVAGTTFSNTAGASALVANAPARWLVYSNDPVNDLRGGLVADFKQYNKAFGDATAIAGSGDGFLYTLAPNANVSLTGVVSKVYDGSDIATLIAGNFTAVGGIDGDIVSVNSGANGLYDTRHAGTGKDVNVNSVIVSGQNGATQVFGYGLANGMASGPVGTISAAPLTVSTTAVTKTYDGTNTAPGGSIFITAGALVPGDTLAGGTIAFADPNVNSGKTVAVSGVTVNDGNSGNNYNVSFVDNTTSSITALAAATWTGNVNAAWANSANWAGGVVPILANVLSVSIPTGSGNVVFDAAAGNTTLQSLTSARPISLTGGHLQIDSLLQTGSYSQSGGLLTGAGVLNVTDSFSQSAGSITMGAININQTAGNLNVGNLSAPVIALSAPTGMITQSGSLTGGGVLVATSQTGSFLTNTGNQVGALSATNAGAGDILFVNTGTLLIQSLTNAGGDINVVNTGGVTTTGAVLAPAGDVLITANSPLTIGAGGITASGDIVLNATNLTSAGDLTLNGVLTSGNKVSLTAGNTMAQNFAVFGANGVTATAGTHIVYGPFAVTNNPPVTYTVAGLTVTPPPTVLASSLQAPGDLLVTFLDLFQRAITGELGGLLELDADGNLRRKNVDGLVSEEELCR